MKKTILLLPVLFLSGSLALAVGPKSAAESGTGDANSQTINSNQKTVPGNQAQNEIQVQQKTQNQGENQNLMIQQQQATQTRTLEEVKNSIQKKQKEITQETQKLETKKQKVYQNQNEVRMAVFSLLEMKDAIGGIGPQISQIAREFDNSVQATIQAEEKIQTRSRIKEFFAGGDRDSANLLEQETNRNQIRIQELKRLKEECDCGEEMQSMIQKQIQNIEQEQIRLKELAQNEKKSKGMFGWLFSWFE